MEADDVTSDNKTRKRTEEAASDRVMCGDSSSAQVDHDPICLTSFGDDSTEPPALPCCRDDALVDKGAEVPKPCLSPVETRTLTATGSLLPAGTASTATRTIFHQLPFWNFCPTKEIDFRLIQYATCSSSFWKIKVLETKIRQTFVCDPGGCTGALRTCPFLGRWRTLFCGRCLFRRCDGIRGWSGFWYTEDLNIIFNKGQAIHYAERIAVGCCLPEARLIRERCQTARGYESWGDERMSRNVMEQRA